LVGAVKAAPVPTGAVVGSGEVATGAVVGSGEVATGDDGGTVGFWEGAVLLLVGDGYERTFRTPPVESW
jgi:hypothetical protein